MQDFHRFKLGELTEDELEGIQGLDAHILNHYSDGIDPYYIRLGHTIGSARINGKVDPKRVTVRSSKETRTKEALLADLNGSFSGLDCFVYASVYQRIYDVDEPAHEVSISFEHPWEKRKEDSISKSALTISNLYSAIKSMRRRMGIKDIEIHMDLAVPLCSALEFPFPFHRQELIYTKKARCIINPIRESAVNAMKEYLGLDESYSTMLISNVGYSTLYYVAHNEDHTHLVFPNPMFFDKKYACDHSESCMFKTGKETIHVIASNHNQNGKIENVEPFIGVYKLSPFLLLSHNNYEKLRNTQGLQAFPYAIDIGNYELISVSYGTTK